MRNLEKIPYRAKKNLREIWSKQTYNFIINFNRSVLVSLVLNGNTIVCLHHKHFQVIYLKVFEYLFSRGAPFLAEIISLSELTLVSFLQYYNLIFYHFNTCFAYLLAIKFVRTFPMIHYNYFRLFLATVCAVKARFL